MSEVTKLFLREKFNLPNLYIIYFFQVNYVFYNCLNKTKTKQLLMLFFPEEMHFEENISKSKFDFLSFSKKKARSNQTNSLKGNCEKKLCEILGIFD
jgi:hypothetical protein